MVSLQQNCGASRKPRQDPAVVRNEESSRELWVFLAQHGPAWFGRKWLLPGTPGSLRATSVAATVDHSVVGPKRRKLLGKQAPPVPLFLASEEVKVRKPKPKVELRVWTCEMPLAGGGICGHRCEGPSEGRKLSCKRANHLANRHAGEDTSKAGTLAKRVEIIDASPALPSESRSWTCRVPGCSAGLPLFEGSYAGRWARDCAIERHRQTAHPGLTRTQMYASRWADLAGDHLVLRTESRLGFSDVPGSINVSKVLLMFLALLAHPPTSVVVWSDVVLGMSSSIWVCHVALSVLQFLDFEPYTGQRIGEASHAGPGGGGSEPPNASGNKCRLRGLLLKL